MSDSEAVKDSKTGPDSNSRPKSILLTIAQFVGRYWSEHGKGDPTSSESREMFGFAGETDVDEVAREVYQRFCAVPDSCDRPQEVLFDLTKQVINRRERSKGRPTASPIAPAARLDHQGRLQSAFQELDPEARKLMRLSLDGKHFREIAQLLELPERRVLDVLRVSYSQLRMRVADCDEGALPAAHAEESIPK